MSGILRRFESTLGIIRTIENWPTALADHLGLARTPYVSKLRNGLRFGTRPGTDDTRILFEIFVRGCYDAAVITPGAVVLDIGANTGVFSIRAGRVASRVVSCEPFPANVAILRRNAEMNRMAHVEVWDCAIASVSGTSQLVLPDDEGYVGRYSLHPGRGSRTIEVRVLSLDDVVREAHLERIDLMKVDCQGSEYEILFGASAATLERVGQIIVECEVFPDRPEWSQATLRAHLERAGFSVHDDGNLLYASRPPSGAN